MSKDLGTTWGSVYVDGRLMPASEGMVSACNRGLLYGDGIFETVRVYNGMPFMLDAHIDRMAGGCSVIRMTPPEADEIRGAARQVLDANGLTGDAYLRITVTRGATGLMWYDLVHDKPTLILLAKPFSPPDFGDGLRITVSPSFRSDERSPLSRIKHTGILWKILPRNEAKSRGFDDSLLLNTAGNVSEGTSANIFWAKDDMLCTPSLECGILPGVTRAAIADIARKHGITVSEGAFPLENLLAADEAFLTSSTAELSPIRSIEDKVFATGAPGPTTIRLSDLYREHVRSLTSEPPASRVGRA